MQTFCKGYDWWDRGTIWRWNYSVVTTHPTVSVPLLLLPQHRVKACRPPRHPSSQRCPPAPPNPPLNSLSLCIFIDEAWQCPNSNMAEDIWYIRSTLENKKKTRKIFLNLPLSVLILHSITAGPNFSFQSWNMIILLFARNINCSRRTHNHWGGKEKLPV